MTTLSNVTHPTRGVGFETPRLRLEPVDPGRDGVLWTVLLKGLGIPLGHVGYLEEKSGRPCLVCSFHSAAHQSPEYAVEALTPVIAFLFEDEDRQEIPVSAWQGECDAGEILARLGFAQDSRSPTARFMLSREAWTSCYKPAAPTMSQLIGDAEIRAAAATTPRDRAEPLDDAGRALQLAGYLTEASRLYAASREADPTYIPAMVHGATAHLDRGDEEGGRRLLEAAAQAPLDGSGCINRMGALHLLGRFQDAWAERKRAEEIWGGPRATEHIPTWDGSPLGGRRILLDLRGGAGDYLLLSRFAPALARTGRVFLLVSEPLRRLLASNFPTVTVLTPADPVPAVDCRASLFALPRLLGTDPTTIPSAPYLAAEADQFRSADSSRPRIGFCWAGNAAHEADETRTSPLSAWRPLVQMSRFQWHSLQFGSRGNDLESVTWGGAVVNRMDAVEDFADFAAYMRTLDLVISIDSAPVHLAGSLGVPVWMLVSATPDPHWGLKRTDSDWYPSLTIFRQRYVGDWGGIVERVRHWLRSWAPR